MSDCPWLGTCVGKGNLRSFHVFLASLTALLLTILLTCALQLAVVTDDVMLGSKLSPSNDGESISNDELPSRGSAFATVLAEHTMTIIILIFAGIFGFAFVFPLTSFHIYLISVGETTNENVRGMWRIGVTSNGSFIVRNPFDRGCVENWRQCTIRLCQRRNDRRTALWRRGAMEPPLLPMAVNAQAQSDTHSIVPVVGHPHTSPDVHRHVRLVDEFEMMELEGRWRKVRTRTNRTNDNNQSNANMATTTNAPTTVSAKTDPTSCVTLHSGDSAPLIGADSDTHPPIVVAPPAPSPVHVHLESSASVDDRRRTLTTSLTLHGLTSMSHAGRRASLSELPFTFPQSAPLSPSISSAPVFLFDRVGAAAVDAAISPLLVPRRANLTSADGSGLPPLAPRIPTAGQTQQRRHGETDTTNKQEEEEEATRNT